MEANKDVREESDDAQFDTVEEVLLSYNKNNEQHRKIVFQFSELFNELTDAIFTVRYLGAFNDKDGEVSLYVPSSQQFLFSDFEESYDSFATTVREIITDERQYENYIIKHKQISLQLLTNFTSKQGVMSVIDKVKKGESSVLASMLFTVANKDFVSSVEWSISPLIKSIKRCTIFEESTLLN